MKQPAYYKHFLLGLFVFVLFQGVAQKDPYEDFNRARAMAFDQRYDSAMSVLDSLILGYPKNEDFILFKASVLHWSGQDSLANFIVDPYIKQTPPNLQAIQVKLQILEGDSLWDESANLCRLGKTYDKKLDTFYMFHEALAYYQLERNEEALACLDTLRTKGYGLRNEDLRTAILKRQKHMVTLGLGATSFPSATIDSWYFSHLQYRRSFKRTAAVFRVNYGNVNKLSSTQAEGDFYWNNTKYSYIYLNYGFSPYSNFFSRHRVGLEYFYERNHFLLSLGGRGLWFTNAEEVLIGTASLGYQWKKFILDYRIFMVSDAQGWVPNHYVYLRHQNDTFERYFQLDFQYGKMPLYYTIAQDFDRQDAYRFGLKAQLRAGDNFFFTPVVAYEIENITDMIQRKRIYFQLMFSKRF